MRLSEEKIKLGILHEEQAVRDMAVSYFAASYSGDRTVMSLAIEAIERFGILSALSDLDALRNLVQTDSTITWLAKEIARLGGSSDQRHWSYVGTLSWILAEAAADLLKRRRKEILELRFLDPDAKHAIEQRTRLLSVSPETCWRDYSDCCRQLTAAGPTPSAQLMAQAFHWQQAISRHPQRFGERLLAMLADEAGEQSGPWAKISMVRAAGEMRLVDAIPHLVRLLQESNEEWTCEECATALTRIGGDVVVKAVWNACALAQGDFLDYAAWVLEGIHSDLSEKAALHLFQSADDDDLDTKITFGHALLSDFAIDGITAVRNLVRQEVGAEEDMLELKQALIAVCTLAEADLPELRDWREQLREEQSNREKWQSPEFPVIDTWTSQLAEASPPQRNEKLEPLPLRIPKVPRFRGVGRNELCPCKSGKKFKNCCMRLG